MAFCHEWHDGRKCGRVAVAYYLTSRNNIKPVCTGHLAMLQTWYRGEAEIGPIGNLLHPDPAAAWKNKQGTLTQR